MADKAPGLMVGGTGALGRKVVSELLDRERRVRMLVRDPVKAEGFARRGVELVHGDIMDLPSLIAAMDGADSVITCATGLHIYLSLRCVGFGTVLVAEAAARVQLCRIA